jgi:hypothetical protein
VDIVQARGADSSLNVLQFMEPPALQNLTIDFNTLDIQPENNYIGVDVIFKHPFLTGGQFRGFDVRGVVFGPEVANADGTTPLLRPKDFKGEAFGYIDGLLGAPDSSVGYTRAENGYKYFCDGLGKDVVLSDFFSSEANLAGRGSFAEGSSNTRHYDLDFAAGETDFFVFNYAVLANYDWPSGDPPYILGDFSLTANMPEPLCFDFTIGNNTLYFDGSNGGGQVDLYVEVWGWHGFDNFTVDINNAAFGGTVPFTSMSPGNTSKSEIFNFEGIQGYPTSNEDLNVTVTATDGSRTYGSSWFLELLSPGNPLYDTNVYAKYNLFIPVGNQPPYHNIIPVPGLVNKNIVITTYSGMPPADIMVNAVDGKPKVMYTTSGWHRTYRFLADYSASDGMLVNYSHSGGIARGFDGGNGYTANGQAYQPTGYPDFGGAVNLWGDMDETGMYMIYIDPNWYGGMWWWSSAPHSEVRDVFDSQDAAHLDYNWILIDCVDASQIRLQYFNTNAPQPGPYMSQWGTGSGTIYNQPGTLGIYGADIKAADALRNEFMFVILEGDDVELWTAPTNTSMTYGGLTISGFTDALDVSVDSQDYIWVLDQPNGHPRLQAFDSTTGDLVATSGEIAGDVNGDPLRIDVDESDDQCHLLHTAGVSVFMIDW